MLKLIETDNSAVICPHCGKEHGDCHEWVHEQSQETTCDNCGLIFECWAEPSVLYVSVADVAEKEEDSGKQDHC